jgi:putative transcriptional regulator
MIDPLFRRTILFIMQNDNSTGSMAVIINRPTGTCLSDIDDAIPPHLAEVPVFLGGPMESNHLIIARIMQVSSNLGFRSIAQEENNIPNNEMWAFFGYAGWKVGQLEQEISAKAWLLVKARPEFFLIKQTQEGGILQWKSIMKQSGPWFHLLSSIPDDVTLN